MKKEKQDRERKGMISIRMKLLVTIVPIVILLIVALVLIAYRTSARIIDRSVAQ